MRHRACMYGMSGSPGCLPCLFLLFKGPQRPLTQCSYFIRGVSLSGPFFLLRTEFGPPKSLQGFKNLSHCAVHVFSLRG